MKIKTVSMDYDDVLRQPAASHRPPRKTTFPFRILLKALSFPELRKVHFTCRRHGMERLGKDEPCLYLMNHSSFIDLKIASTILYPRPFNIVCTSDGFVGKEWLMRSIGCIPTQKFVTDQTLVRDMLHALRTLKSSVLLFPEAGYSFDGTAIRLPESLGKCLKLLRVPVVMIRTSGAFSRDPLYNNLQLRRVDVSADMTYLLSPEEIAAAKPEELNRIVQEQFQFDHFRWQQESRIRISEPFRADQLNRVLYQCPACLQEGCMHGEGITLRCKHCGKTYILDEYGYLQAQQGETEFSHIPDWYAWQRKQVRGELEAGRYRLEVPVDICMLTNTRCLYRVGSGVLTHTPEGFTLDGCNGRLHYQQRTTASYSLNSDYYWYEIGDMISIGDRKALYYCFPKGSADIVTKTRLAAEELYQMEKDRRSAKLRQQESSTIS